MNNEVVIVIPIYKKFINKNEKIAINQCIKVLNKYDKSFILPENLDYNYYKNKFPKYKCISLRDGRGYYRANLTITDEKNE